MTPPPPTPTPLDIVSVAILLSALFVGREMADILAPYAVILLGALGGATWSAAQLPMPTRWHTARHVLLMVGLALIATVPLSILGGKVFGLEQHWLFAPIAVLVAARPSWVIQQLRGVIADKLKPASSGSNTDQGGRP